MAAHVIGERRREPRQAVSMHGSRPEPRGAGVRLVDVVDVSAHGLRCHVSQPIRPGRVMRLELPGLDEPIPALVVRCVVVRLSRSAVVYEVAWATERLWWRG